MKGWGALRVDRRTVRLSVGILSWGIAAILLGGLLAARPDSTRADHQLSVARYLLLPSRSVTATDTTGRVRRNDPVFLHDSGSPLNANSPGEPGGRWRQVGYVRDVVGEPGSRRVSILWHDEHVDPRSCDLVLHQQGGGLEDVVTVMFPPEKRERIRQRLAEIMAEHGEQLTATLRPLVEQTFRESLPIIEEEFRESVLRHREDIDQLGERLHHEVVAERLIPMAKREVLPIVRRHGQPPLEEIGRELWDRASLWRFGWRAMYDKSPFPRRSLVRNEWERFVEAEAIPVFEDHLDELVVAMERILTDIAANPAVRSELASELERLANDPETNRLARAILRETFVENQRLRDRWREIWTDESARLAISEAGQRLEPGIRQIGDELFGTREEGIDPNFARVLRSQILGKDRRWLVARPRLETASPDADRRPSIVRAETPMAYPLVYLADESADPAGVASESDR